MYPSEPVQWLDATCWLCLRFRKVEVGDFPFFSSYTGKISFYHKFIHTVLILITIVNTHTQTLTQMYMHIVFRHTQQRKNYSFLWKKTTTCNSEIKCYTFCKMFHNSLYWFKWLSSVHTQPAAIVPHLMLMNACCMDTSCIIPFICVSVDFSMAKKWMLSIFIPWEQIFAFNSSQYKQFIHVVQGFFLFICVCIDSLLLIFGLLMDNLTITDEWQSHRSLTTTPHSMYKTHPVHKTCLSQH